MRMDPMDPIDVALFNRGGARGALVTMTGIGGEWLSTYRTRLQKLAAFRFTPVPRESFFLQKDTDLRLSVLAKLARFLLKKLETRLTDPFSGLADTLGNLARRTQIPLLAYFGITARVRKQWKKAEDRLVDDKSAANFPRMPQPKTRMGTWALKVLWVLVLAAARRGLQPPRVARRESPWDVPVLDEDESLRAQYDALARRITTLRKRFERMQEGHLGEINKLKKKNAILESNLHAQEGKLRGLQRSSDVDRYIDELKVRVATAESERDELRRRLLKVPLVPVVVGVTPGTEPAAPELPTYAPDSPEEIGELVVATDANPFDLLGITAVKAMFVGLVRSFDGGKAELGYGNIGRLKDIEIPTLEGDDAKKFFRARLLSHLGYAIMESTSNEIDSNLGGVAADMDFLSDKAQLLAAAIFPKYVADRISTIAGFVETLKSGLYSLCNMVVTGEETSSVPEGWFKSPLIDAVLPALILSNVSVGTVSGELVQNVLPPPRDIVRAFLHGAAKWEKITETEMEYQDHASAVTALNNVLSSREVVVRDEFRAFLSEGDVMWDKFLDSMNSTGAPFVPALALLASNKGLGKHLNQANVAYLYWMCTPKGWADRSTGNNGDLSFSEWVATVKSEAVETEGEEEEDVDARIGVSLRDRARHAAVVHVRIDGQSGYHIGVHKKRKEVVVWRGKTKSVYPMDETTVTPDALLLLRVRVRRKEFTVEFKGARELQKWLTAYATALKRLGRSKPMGGTERFDVTFQKKCRLLQRSLCGEQLLLLGLGGGKVIPAYFFDGAWRCITAFNVNAIADLPSGFELINDLGGRRVSATVRLERGGARLRKLAKRAGIYFGAQDEETAVPEIASSVNDDDELIGVGFLDGLRGWVDVKRVSFVADGRKTSHEDNTAFLVNKKRKTLTLRYGGDEETFPLKGEGAVRYLHMGPKDWMVQLRLGGQRYAKLTFGGIKEMGAFHRAFFEAMGISDRTKSLRERGENKAKTRFDDLVNQSAFPVVYDKERCVSGLRRVFQRKASPFCDRGWLVIESRMDDDGGRYAVFLRGSTRIIHAERMAIDVPAVGSAREVTDLWRPVVLRGDEKEVTVRLDLGAFSLFLRHMQQGIRAATARLDGRRDGRLEPVLGWERGMDMMEGPGRTLVLEEEASEDVEVPAKTFTVRYGALLDLGTKDEPLMATISVLNPDENSDEQVDTLTVTFDNILGLRYFLALLPAAQNPEPSMDLYALAELPVDTEIGMPWIRIPFAFAKPQRTCGPGVSASGKCGRGFLMVGSRDGEDVMVYVFRAPAVLLMAAAMELESLDDRGRAVFRAGDTVLRVRLDKRSDVRKLRSSYGEEEMPSLPEGIGYSVADFPGISSSVLVDEEEEEWEGETVVRPIVTNIGARMDEYVPPMVTNVTFVDRPSFPSASSRFVERKRQRQRSAEDFPGISSRLVERKRQRSAEDFPGISSHLVPRMRVDAVLPPSPFLTTAPAQSVMASVVPVETMVDEVVPIGSRAMIVDEEDDDPGIESDASEDAFDVMFRMAAESDSD